MRRRLASLALDCRRAATCLCMCPREKQDDNEQQITVCAGCCCRCWWWWWWWSSSWPSERRCRPSSSSSRYANSCSGPFHADGTRVLYAFPCRVSCFHVLFSDEGSRISFTVVTTNVCCVSLDFIITTIAGGCLFFPPTNPPRRPPTTTKLLNRRLILVGPASHPASQLIVHRLQQVAIGGAQLAQSKLFISLG